MMVGAVATTLRMEASAKDGEAGREKDGPDDDEVLE